ncbi:hypothetical protein F5Y09DRAFT_95713 [Xylaria sp. FL1042]|nr:hypothetical protein F5Y09DRAFT_95713 [Xylaria sp. FL1042]
MPPTAKSHQNTSGIVRQTDDGIYYANGRYLCQKIKDGKPCGSEISAKKHNVTSHNSSIHTNSAYLQKMARGEFECKEGCGKISPTYQAMVGHLRRKHGYRGNSAAIKAYYNEEADEKAKQDDKKSPSDAGEENREETLQNGNDFIDPRLLAWDVSQGE